MSQVLQRAREGGRCPPSFLIEENMTNEDEFESQMLRVLGTSDFTLSSDPSVPAAFESLMKKAGGMDDIPGDDMNRKRAVLELRRMLILALVGGTPKSSPSMDQILSTGYLVEVREWLDQILKGFVGGVDLLLHLLKNIADLPVTTSMVKDSELGKAVGSIEKHKICSGTPNEGPIKEKVAIVKERWKASVRARKIVDGPSISSPKLSVAPKREAESNDAMSPTAKRVKVTDLSPQKSTSSSISSLLKKMTGGGSLSLSVDSSKNNKVSNGIHSTGAKSNSKASPTSAATANKKKKQAARVKWADHFGGDLEDAKLIEGENTVVQAPQATSESWSDRKKRDREKEKKLLLTMKKSKLNDDDDGDVEPVVLGVKASVAWGVPALLPELPGASKPQLNSTEVSAQNERMKTTTPARYYSDNDVPSSPAALSDIEQALDMTAQSSANVASLPFFASVQTGVGSPQLEAVPETLPVPQVDYSTLPSTAAPAPPMTRPVGATPEFVQALGLPLFLVGQDPNALQSLARAPELLNSLVDSTGMYDQARLLSLVQTLSGAPAVSAPFPPIPQYAPPIPLPTTSPYGAGAAYPAYGGGNAFPSARPARGSDEGNLHVSGYGPMTTQSDLINLFSPYVVVDEVVMKGTFAFVNTSDPFNAQRAREALHGTLLGGQPIRINQAQRKGRDSGPPTLNPSTIASSAYGPAGGAPAIQYGSQLGAAMPNHHSAPPPFQPPPQPTSVDDVRDSRGNAPTKNLFVAGYGPGTTEMQIRQIFALHVHVIGVVLKGNFTFVNTCSREDAVKAREMLQGNMINGGPLRINFAKETGRLGTSFDLTYNQQSGPNARRDVRPGPGPGAAVSGYYGR